MARPILERSLPHNIDAEKSVLGAILVNNENYYRVVEFVRPEDFYFDSHRVIFRQMIELMERSRAIDLITIQDELLRNSSLGPYVYPVVPSEFSNWRDEQRA